MVLLITPLLFGFVSHDYFFVCRRRCLKPRQQHHKLQLSGLSEPKRDQATSTSRLNLISTSHLDSTSTADSDLRTPVLRSAYSSREDFCKSGGRSSIQHSTDTLPLRPGTREDYPLKSARSGDLLESEDLKRNYGGKGQRRRGGRGGNRDPPPSPPPLPPPFKHVIGDSKPPDYLMTQSADPLSRPTSLTGPGQLIFCGSIDHMKEGGYRHAMPTLVIPAHYVRLSSEDNPSGQSEEQSESDSVSSQASHAHHFAPQDHAQRQQLLQQSHNYQQGGPNGSGQEQEGKGWSNHSSQMSGSVTIPVVFNESTMAQLNGELQALTEKKLLELGVKPHPRAWFVSLDGRSSQVRHSYIDLQTGDKIRSNDASLDSGVDVNEIKVKPGPEEGRGGRSQHQPSSLTYSKLVFAEEGEQSLSESRTGGGCSPEDSSLTPLLDEASESCLGMNRRGRSRGDSSRSSTSELRRDSMTSPDEDLNDQSEGGDDQDKKSPWQKREERPLMVFNVK